VLFFPRRQLLHGVMVSLAAYACQLFFLVWRPDAYISSGPFHLLYKLTRIQVAVPGRVSAVLEVSLVFACMVCAALLVRRWCAGLLGGFGGGFAYLVALMAVPSALDFLVKLSRYGSVLYTLSAWEGANWLSSCLPPAAILVLAVLGEVKLADGGPAAAGAAGGSA
jgi:hypothetical protein